MKFNYGRVKFGFNFLRILLFFEFKRTLLGQRKKKMKVINFFFLI